MNQEAMNNFQQLYHQLQRGTVDKNRLSGIYADNIRFRDPFHQINGLDAMTEYFSGLYENVEHIQFDFGRCWFDNDCAFIRWTMTYQHPRINSGKRVTVDGGSELTWQDGKIIAHQDFFDAGQMLYEHLPLLRWLIKKLKERMQ